MRKTEHTFFPRIKPLDHYWYTNGLVAFSLWPASWLFCGVSALRRYVLRGRQKKLLVRVPVVVVGNISVGGTGKTPMVVWLANFLKAYGYRPGIVSRGYGAKTKDWPKRVFHHSKAESVGDEPLLIAQRTSCPVYVDPDRVHAINTMLRENDVNIIISDDGLQHYRMPRDIEIVMIDGHRRFGNQLCLPAGPLREPLGRMKDADFRVVTEADASSEDEFSMRLEGGELINIRYPNRRKLLSDFKGQAVHAVAGIGNPMRFFATLTSARLKIIMHPFPDHHDYTVTDFQFDTRLPIIMTEKDAVKCKHLVGDDAWYLPVKPRLSHEFAGALIKRLREKTYG